MTPGVNGDLMVSHVLGLKISRKLNGARANDKECRFQIRLV